MDSLPTELHHTIFDLICASPSGGNSIHALSLTNSYFHDLAAPFLFHTLVVSSTEQTEKMISLLGAVPEAQRRIHRLFLSSGGTGPRLSSAAVHLLHLAAPTLRNLAVICGSSSFSSSLLGAVFRTPFPCLKTLAVRGMYPTPPPGTFPALTHLHLAGNRSPAGVPTALAAGACPRLTHLRVSGLRGAPAFARELSGVLTSAGENEGEKNIFLGRLESIVLETETSAPAQKVRGGRVAQLRDEEMREILGTLKSAARVGLANSEEQNAARSTGPHVQVMDMGEEVNVHIMKRAWLDMACV